MRSPPPDSPRENDVPSSASSDVNPLGGKANDSMERKGAAQTKNNKGKSHKQSPP